MPAAHGAADCDACGAVWGLEHRCPHCASLSRAAAGGEFRWTCPDCGGMRLPPRVARLLGGDPDGSLAQVHCAYTAWLRRAKARRRALLVTAIATPAALLGIGAGFLSGADELDAARVVLAFLVAALALVAAGVAWFRLRLLTDRAEAAAVDERGELRRTYRRAVSLLAREEELTDDELAELVQSTRDIRRVRIAAGGLDTSRVAAAPAPPDLATDSLDDGVASEGEAALSRARSQ